MIKDNFQNGFLEDLINSHKSHFIEWCQANKVDYKYDVQPHGPENNKHYLATLIADGQVFKGTSSSKKKAEETASYHAYFALVEKSKIIGE
jgi:ribonuclease-3